MTVPVAVYTRVSKDEAGTQTTTARQDRICRQFAEMRSWDVIETFEDVDVSAYRRGVIRPAYEKMCRDIAEHRVQGVVVWKLDRLVRRTAEFERFWAICEKAGCVLASVTEPIDTSTELGIGIVRILVAFAGLESATKSIRLVARQRELAERGEPHRMFRVFGYTKDWSETIPEEAAMVREAAAAVLAGIALKRVARDWNAAGRRTTRGSRWNHENLRQLLLARRFTAEREYHGVVVAKGTWPAILDDDTARRVREILEDPLRRVGKPNSYLLSGLVECDRCSAPMYAFKRYDHVAASYRCAQPPYGCGRMSVRTTLLHDHVSTAVLDRIRARQRAIWPPDPTNPTTGDGNTANIRHVTAEAVRALGRDFYVAKAITRPEFLYARGELLRSMEEQLRAIEPGHARPVDPSWEQQHALSAWPQLNMADQQAIIRREVKRIRVKPSPQPVRRFAPERVHIVWW